MSLARSQRDHGWFLRCDLQVKRGQPACQRGVLLGYRAPDLRMALWTSLRPLKPRLCIVAQLPQICRGPAHVPFTWTAAHGRRDRQGVMSVSVSDAPPSAPRAALAPVPTLEDPQDVGLLWRARGWRKMRR
jgi:hypothetical protein